MNIKKIPVGFLEANCYILEKSGKALVIDPGDEYNKIKEQLTDLKVVGVLLTHSHTDHVGALRSLLKGKNVKVYKQNNLVEGNNSIDCFNFNVIFTKGHSSDSVTYYFYEDEVMFTGDFLFKDTIGRCDLPTGSINEMRNSLELIKKYKENIKIYPGHGEISTLEYILKNNEYLK